MDANELYDPEFRELIKPKQPTFIIPVGSLEQHGAHLPVSTDSDIVTEIASRLGKKCGFIVLPTISYGISVEHYPLFNASISPQNFGDVLMDVVRSLLTNNIKSIIILNGHHGNAETIERLESFLSYTHQIQLRRSGKKGPLVGVSVKQANHIKEIKKEFKSVKLRTYSYWQHMEHEFDHAGFVETSLMLAISDKVKMKKAKKGLITKGLSEKEIQRINKLSTQPGGFPQVTKNGVWGDPTNATKKDGEKFLAEIVRNLAKECQS